MKPRLILPTLKEMPTKIKDVWHKNVYILKNRNSVKPTNRGQLNKEWYINLIKYHVPITI